MGFTINTNIAALNAHRAGSVTSKAMGSSIERLSSGLRINRAADDASGMAIADSLRSQASGLSQAIRNANDATGIIQTADKAMDEQIKILDTIKTKALQAAQDGQTTETRKAIQSDIVRLLEELDNIANTTSFNGQALLSGAFTNREFQIGSYHNTTVKASVNDTRSNQIGQIRTETASHTYSSMLASAGLANLSTVKLRMLKIDGEKNFDLQEVKISTSPGTGIGALAEVINRYSESIGVKAHYSVTGTGELPIASGSLHQLVINDITIGDIFNIKANDSDGRLITAINNLKDETGVEAYTDGSGKLNLRSIDGRAISMRTDSGAALLGGGSFLGISPPAAISETQQHAIIGRLTLTRLSPRDIIVSGLGYSFIGFHTAQGIAERTMALSDIRGHKSNTMADIASAIGANPNAAIALDNKLGIGAGVTSLRGAMVVMDMAETALATLDRIRADLGSVQIQLESTINNITITQVNVKAAESEIRDVDFAAESSNFSKHNILAQSGNFAMAQANSVQQYVLKLLQ